MVSIFSKFCSFFFSSPGQRSCELLPSLGSLVNLTLDLKKNCNRIYFSAVLERNHEMTKIKHKSLKRSTLERCQFQNRIFFLNQFKPFYMGCLKLIDTLCTVECVRWSAADFSINLGQQS